MSEATPKLDTLSVGQELPRLQHKPDNVQLMMYNAALWNGHRIHFDLPYAQEVEGYPGLVIAGPLIGDWLTQCLLGWLGDAGRMTQLEYSNRAASYIGETLTSSGQISAVDTSAGTAEVALAVLNEAGEVITPGTALVAFGPSA